MEKGQIVEDGRHEDLLRREGPYATLYYQQVGIPFNPAQGARS
jgi:ABC-type multidrug transport system fused ATPase/permease subunit